MNLFELLQRVRAPRRSCPTPFAPHAVRALITLLSIVILGLPSSVHAQFSTFSGNYYQSTTPSGNAVAGSTYSNISFDFIAVPPPAPIVENKGFSASYTGSFVAQYSGYYKFTTAADDGIRLSINGNSIINQWQDQPATPTTSSVFLLARASIYSYPVTLEYYENGVGPASLSLSYTELFDNAQYISTTLPTTMFAGRSYSGTITLRNTGTSTWTNNNYDIKYTLLANAYTKNLWGPNSVSESYIPDSILTLDPNLTMSFPFTLTAPKTPGTYPFQCQMMDSRHGSFGSLVSLQITVIPPPPPTNLTATAGNAKVQLSWTAPNGTVSSYNVKRCQSQAPGGPYTTVSGTGSVTGTTYTDTAVFNRTKYYYVVTAVNAAGESDNSNEASATPAAPDDSQLVSSTFPATMTAGQSYSGTIVMKNVGTSTWFPLTADITQGYYLSVVDGQTPLTWGGTGYCRYAEVGTIAPGQTATFTFSVTAPAKPGSYPFLWQMVHWNVAIFGDKTFGSVYVILDLKLAAQVVWTSDSTTTPVTQAASASGKFGGNSSVHLTLTAPQTLTSATATTVTLHEVSGNSADTVFTNLPLSGGPSSVCGEPLASPPPNTTARYLDLPWNIGGHNGNYTVTATVSVLVGDFTQAVTLASPLMVDREDLIIPTDAAGNLMTTPQNPTPILWDPTNPALPNPVTLTAKVTAAYKTGGTALVSIYHSYDNVNPVLKMTKPFLTTDGQVSFTWDGTTNVSDSNGGFLSADPGVYLFQFVVTDNLGSRDCDKSNFPGQSAGLQNPAPPSPFAIPDPNDIAMKTYLFSYSLASLDIPTRSGYSGQVDTFDLVLINRATRMLTLRELTSGNHTVPIVVPQQDDYTFLVSVLDADAYKDKAHRRRYALQHNQTVAGVCRGALFGSSDILPVTMTNVWDYLHNQGFWYNNAPGGKVAPALQLTWAPNIGYASDEPRMDKSAAQAWNALKFSGKSKGPLCWFFLGHGSSGNALKFANNTWLVADRANDKQPNVGQRSYVEDFAPNELAKVWICVLAGCTSGSHSTASNDTSRIAAMLRNKGVQNTVNFNQHVPEAIAALWAEHFWKYATQGDTPGIKSAVNPQAAASLAQDDIIATGSVQFLLNHGNYSFVQFNGQDIPSTIQPDP